MSGAGHCGVQEHNPESVVMDITRAVANSTGAVAGIGTNASENWLKCVNVDKRAVHAKEKSDYLAICSLCQ